MQWAVARPGKCIKACGIGGFPPLADCQATVEDAPFLHPEQRTYSPSLVELNHPWQIESGRDQTQAGLDVACCQACKPAKRTSAKVKYSSSRSANTKAYPVSALLQLLLRAYSLGLH
eukprot:scaffold6493_cov45-Prasinocladus_malaysianus.AAC.1